ncbi:hypothetical protein [Sphingobacterium lactis]|uniref:Uncharacterized protein n=1 Tax=Sphingobacterium lactis TaxID=797291 RepID=A0A1H5SLJ6_9SPHI|nr:hypothetical protein [Sphingobacterium lactis]SEF50721.1 hypothetical protein SAMN05421877_101286 [Sphingobacterium lactis]
MRTFWTYFFIFLTLVVILQVFNFFFSSSSFDVHLSDIIKQLTLVTLIALITSYIVPRKKKNHHLKKKPTDNSWPL